MDPLAIIHQHFEESIATKRQALLNVAEQVALGAILIAESLRHGRKILTCGNGGSAGDATHFSSEMVNRFEAERAGLPAIALTADTSTLTSIANDYSYDVVFARQVCALGKAGDVLVAITTSGKSQNLISAVQTARTRGLRILALTGRDGGAIPPLLDPEDVEIRIPSDSTARIQESHLVVIHCLCDLIERLIFTESR